MRLTKLVKILSIILLSLNLMGASSCNKKQPPPNHPCLLDFTKCTALVIHAGVVEQMNCTCDSYTMVDPQNLKYQKDHIANITDLQGGWGFPKGELEAFLQWGRDEMNPPQQIKINHPPIQ